MILLIYLIQIYIYLQNLFHICLNIEFLESDKSVLFAPKDTEIIKFDQKGDTYGLDFDSFKNATEFIPQSSNIKGN